jgi:RNAse (barnase) inhibitor barstar
MMNVIQIQTNKIKDWKSFHSYFQKVFGFFQGYGKNMNAWIDCMTNLDDRDGGLTEVTVKAGEILTLELKNVDDFKKRCPDIYDSLIECTAFVNHRRIEVGDDPILTLSFFMRN